MVECLPDIDPLHCLPVLYCWLQVLDAGGWRVCKSAIPAARLDPRWSMGAVIRRLKKGGPPGDSARFAACGNPLLRPCTGTTRQNEETQQREDWDELKLTISPNFRARPAAATGPAVL